jgi:transposase
MRFVPVKSIDRQARLMVHRARQGFVQARTACINRIRGLLCERGIVLPLKAATVRRQADERQTTARTGLGKWPIAARRFLSARWRC